jgi:polar amino acid transport system substrate-binding protein
VKKWVRNEDLIIPESFTQDFCSYSRRRNRRIAGYATVSTTLKTDKKTSQDSDIIKSSLLSIIFLIMLLSSNADARQLNIVVNSWPPYVDKILPNRGLAVEIVSAALQRKEYQFSIRVEPWSRALEGLEIGIFDMVGAVWKTPERERFLMFSEPYLVNQIKFIKKKSLPLKFASLADLNGYLIGVVKNYAYEEEFVKSSNLIKIPENYIIQNLLKLVEGEIDLTLGDERAVLYTLNHYMQGSKKDLILLEQPLSERGLRIGVSKMNPAAEKIITDFNQAIKEMKADGSLAAIIQKYQF